MKIENHNVSREENNSHNDDVDDGFLSFIYFFVNKKLCERGPRM